MIIFTDRLSYYQFIQNVEYDIRVIRNKEIWNKNEKIAVYKPEKL